MAARGTRFLGRYRIVDELGAGGMSTVYLACTGPDGSRTWVAIKRLHPHLTKDDVVARMFLDEARIAARVSHPNVAAVFDVGEQEDTYWIAMEYLDGEPLREVMRRNEELGAATSLEIACRIIADAAQGLHAAHELADQRGRPLGLVHRDITPHNMFVTYAGMTKVVDFGVAKFSSRMSGARAGTLKSKLAYMSPEQVHGEGVDRRTDIFALGVVLWELTTGRRLFRMGSDLDTLARVQECCVPRPSAVVPGYPVALERITMRALAKRREERHDTAFELVRELEAFLQTRGSIAEPSLYLRSILGDAIEKRDALLRRAETTTRTIDVPPP
jgi:serine/threonine-protein kinase